MRPPLKERGGKDEKRGRREEPEERKKKAFFFPPSEQANCKASKGEGHERAWGGEGVKDSPTLISLSLLALYKERGRGRFWVDSPTPKPTSPPQPS